MGRILIIDDDAKIREVLTRYLETDDHEVVQAESGEKGLIAARQESNQPDLIILDVSMPEMNGLEVLEALKKHTGTCSIPVLMLTALHDDEIMRSSIENYAVHFLTKPISMSELREKVSSTLGQ